MTTDTATLIQASVFNAEGLLEKAKKNMIIEHNADDDLILGFILAAVAYAERKQKKPTGIYGKERMPPQTEQAVIMLTAHFYESRDGSTGGFFADSVSASERTWETIDKLLMLDKDWRF